LPSLPTAKLSNGIRAIRSRSSTCEPIRTQTFVNAINICSQMMWLAESISPMC
jgi:hypothetical protein